MIIVTVIVTKAFIKVPVVKEIVTETKIDSTYTIALEDSIAELMTVIHNFKPKVIEIITVKDSIIYVPVNDIAYKEYSYLKHETISDSIINLDMDISIIGIDSVFVADKNIAIKKTIDIGLSNISYKHKQTIIEKEKLYKESFSFNVGFGIDMFSNNDKQILCENVLGAITIKNKHTFLGEYKFGDMKGLGLKYAYKLFSF